MQREKGWRAPKSGYGRPHGKDAREARWERAKERIEWRANLTDEQQLVALDRRLGRGVGAKRERARLLVRIGRSAAGGKSRAA